MKRLYLIILAVIIVDLLFQKCANPISPTGGPKDTIPPTLINTFPITGTTNFKEQTITLEFDEFINADKLQQNLVITPKSDLKFKHQVKRMQLILKFETEFEDSTTYNLNFFDGVTDITERNPVINLSIAFSTGSFIDSMSVSGYVNDLFTQEPNTGYTVALYPISDTLDYFTHNPLYFSTTDQSGYFQINYIKSGKYKIISFDDENRNLLLDPETEPHGFIADTLRLFDADSTEYQIRTQLLNVKPINYINSRPVAQYIESKYSREIKSYQVLPDSIHSIIVGEKNDGVRLYNKNQFNYNDSIQFILNTSDSLGNTTIDTVKTVFLESNRKLPSFSSTILNQGKQPLGKEQNIKVSFNKPIDNVDTTKFFFERDSTLSIAVSPTIQWSKHKTEALVKTNLNLDSVIQSYIDNIPEDTTQSDSTKNTKSKEEIERTITMKMYKGAFYSIENDTSKTLTISFEEEKEQVFGKINFTITTDHESFQLQLLMGKKVAHSITNNKNVSISDITPGEYKIRVLIDDNNDGVWSHGNILKNEEAETVYLYPEKTSVRENWEIDLSITIE